MRYFGMLWILLSLLTVGLGAYLIAVTATNFYPEAFAVAKLVIGSLWVIVGGAVLFLSVKLLVAVKIKDSLDRRSVRRKNKSTEERR